MRSACIAVVAATAFSADFNYDTYDGTLDCTNPVAIKAPYCWPVTFKTQDGAGGAAPYSFSAPLLLSFRLACAVALVALAAKLFKGGHAALFKC